MKIPETIALTRDGQYCILCASESISRVQRSGNTVYACASCGKESGRSIVIDSGIRWWVDPTGDYWHESAGVLVIFEGKVLCLMRTIFPYAYTIPAGHVDATENPTQAAIRELQEETKIDAVDALEHIADFDLAEDSCRRGSDHHRWHLFRLQLSAAPSVRPNDETDRYAWFTVDELRARNDLTFPLRWIVETHPGKLSSLSA